MRSSVSRCEAEIEKTDGKCSMSTTYKHEPLDQVPDYNKKYTPVPGIPVTTWTENEKKVFLLGLYIFGKNLVQVRRFMECKKTRANTQQEEETQQDNSIKKKTQPATAKRMARSTLLEKQALKNSSAVGRGAQVAAVLWTGAVPVRNKQ